MYCISLLNVQQNFWINLSACVVLLEYEIELVLTGHCFLWDEKQSRHLIYLPSSQGGPTTVAEKCQVLWILCCKVHFLCMGRTGEWVFKLLKKCIKALITYQGHAGNQELCRRIGTCALRKHNSCKIRVCSEGNMMQGRSSATYLFYDQVHIMGYPIEPSPLTILGKESNNKNGNLRWISPWFSSWMNEWFFLKTI